MKNVIFIFISLFLNSIIAQDLKISIQDIRTEEKIFKGTIDSKYDISVYLKYFNLSDDNLGIYSVKGWYYYDKIKKKIPLVGIYDGSLTLFSIKSKEKQDKILDFGYEGMTWKVVDTIKAINDYDEKFSYSSSDLSINEWNAGKKKLKLEFYNTDISVLEEYQILNINYKKETKTINLSDIIQYDRDFELVNYTKNLSEIRILLKYNHPSRYNVQGMCGAGSEEGYIILIYDKDFNLLNIQRTEIESCLNDIYNEEIKSNLKNKVKLKITKSNEKSEILIIDKNLIEINTE